MRDYQDWADRLITVIDRLKTQLEAGERVYESQWMDPLMELHGEILGEAETSVIRDS